MKAGDSLEIREGNYLEEIHISNLYGTPSFPIVIRPYSNEQVTMDGTVEINTDWTVTDTEHLYKTILEEDIWQLFKNDMIQTAGRFPNASWEDDSIFKLKQSTRQIKPYDSSFGYTVDARPSNAGHTSDDNYDEGADFGTIGEDENLIALSDNGVDYTGSVAVLHMGSWLSWANIVSEHAPGSGTFTYDTTDFSRSGPIMGSNVYNFAGREAFWDKKNNQHSEGFYFLEGLACVDTDGECYYTPKDKSLYVYSSEGEPTGSYKGKVQTYAIALEHSSHVTLSGLDFFGTTVSFKESTDMLLENSDFLYPSYNKMVLGDFRRPDVTEMKADKYTVSNNSIINCTFIYMDGPALELSGQNNLVDNSYMSHIDYTTLGTGAEGTINMIDSWFVTFSNNTVHTAGNSEGIRVGKGSKIINNHVYNMSLIQHDGSLINVGAKDDMQKNTVISGNWSHDSYKASVRFDSANMGNPDTVLYGQYGTIADNIVWNAGPIKVKGNNHTVTGNVGFAPKSAISIAILDNPSMGGFNDGTVTSGNAGILSSSFGSVISTLPGTDDFYIDQVELYDITGETEEPLPEVELMNGDFEDGTKYWANHGCSFEADTTLVKNGAASLRIFDRNNDSTGPAQYMDIAPGRKYNVSMSVKLADGIGTAYFRYVYADKTKRPDAIIAAIDSADGWVELSGVLDLSEETEGLGTRPFIKLFIEDTEAAPWEEVQEYWIDDVVIEAVE